MTYTLSWLDAVGGLCELTLPFDGLLVALPALHARATVVGETGIVCGGVRERLEERRQDWQWWLDLDGARGARLAAGRG